MAELHHKMKDETEKCGVKGCNSPAIRSMPTKKLEGKIAGGLKGEDDRRTHLCKEHYKEYKRKSKDERLTDSLGWQR